MSNISAVIDKDMYRVYYKAMKYISNLIIFFCILNYILCVKVLYKFVKRAYKTIVVGGKKVTEWSERVAKNLKFPRELHNAIENYRKQNMIPYFSTAVYELIRKGLQAAEKEKER